MSVSSWFDGLTGRVLRIGRISPALSNATVWVSRCLLPVWMKWSCTGQNSSLGRKLRQGSGPEADAQLRERRRKLKVDQIWRHEETLRIQPMITFSRTFSSRLNFPVSTHRKTFEGCLLFLRGSNIIRIAQSICADMVKISGRPEGLWFDESARDEISLDKVSPKKER
jgi:hypothetical protein